MKFKNMLQLSTLEKVSLILAIALIVSLLPLPYGFYSLLRLATTVIAGCWAYRFYRLHKISLSITAGAIALLFQPFFKITLDRFTWNIVDVILACIIFFFIMRHNSVP